MGLPGSALRHADIAGLSRLLSAGAQGLDRRKDVGLPGSAFPMDLPSPGDPRQIMPIPDVSQPPQPMIGATGMGPSPLSVRRLILLHDLSGETRQAPSISERRC